MSDLDQARKRIDCVDQEILDLLAARMEIAEQVATYKKEHGLPILDEQREQSIIEDRTALAVGLGLPPGADELFRIIMKMSRERQHELLGGQEGRKRRAVFQGVPGANSHLALLKLLGNNVEATACDSFQDVFNTVETGEAAFGVVPIENSFAGSVIQVYDLLSTHAVYITGEKLLRIDHMLMAPPGSSLEDIRDVYSHEQALAQCSDFLAAHPAMTPHPYFNTAGAAAFVAERQNPACAALANESAAELYGLQILADSVNTSKDNTTRFILIAPEPYRGLDANKASVIFTLAHRPGSLAEAMALFAAQGLNMVKIESRPLRDRNFEYSFYVDFEGADVRPKLEKALRVDTTLFPEIRLLGAYRKSKVLGAPSEARLGGKA